MAKIKGNTHRIESRVDVAEPESKGKAPRLDVARLANRSEQVEEEEWQPARYERAHDEAKDERGTLLPLATDPASFAGRILLADHHSARVDHLDCEQKQTCHESSRQEKPKRNKTILERILISTVASTAHVDPVITGSADWWLRDAPTPAPMSATWSIFWTEFLFNLALHKRRAHPRDPFAAAGSAAWRVHRPIDMHRRRARSPRITRTNRRSGRASITAPHLASPPLRRAHVLNGRRTTLLIPERGPALFASSSSLSGNSW